MFDWFSHSFFEKQRKLVAVNGWLKWQSREAFYVFPKLFKTNRFVSASLRYTFFKTSYLSFTSSFGISALAQWNSTLNFKLFSPPYQLFFLHFSFIISFTFQSKCSIGFIWFMLFKVTQSDLILVFSISRPCISSDFFQVPQHH